MSADLPVILIIAVLVMTIEHLATMRLAKTHSWARLSRPQAYAVGLGTVLALFTVHAYFANALALARDAWLVAVAAGLPVLLLWGFDGDTPRDEWPGLGSKRPTNRALALIEDAMAFGAQASVASDSLREAMPMLMALLAMLHDLRTDCPEHEPTVRELRALVMAQLKKEETK